MTNALIKDGKVSRGWLGVTIQDVTKDMAEAQGLDEARGAIIADVNEQSPAKKAGLRRGDVILSVNGKDATDATSVTRMVGSLMAGSSNDFMVLRDGKRQRISVTVGERPANPNALVATGSTTPGSDSSEAEEGPLGVSLLPLDNATRSAMGLDADEAGLLVGKIENDSPLRETIVRPGSVILSAGGAPLKSVADLSAAIEDAKSKGRGNLLLAVRNGQQTLFVTVSIEESTED